MRTIHSCPDPPRNQSQGLIHPLNICVPLRHLRFEYLCLHTPISLFIGIIFVTMAAIAVIIGRKQLNHRWHRFSQIKA